MEYLIPKASFVTDPIHSVWRSEPHSPKLKNQVSADDAKEAALAVQKLFPYTRFQLQ